MVACEECEEFFPRKRILTGCRSHWALKLLN
jgi:hypothetical protein